MRVLRPRTPAEAVRLLGRHPEALPLAGGTDFMVGWNVGLLNGRTVLDLSPLRDWQRIRRTGAGLVIGALTTHARLRDDTRVRSAFPLLAESASVIGAAAIQNRGTLGGNIANASPAGDTFPPLAVYEAVVQTVSPDGERRTRFLNVFEGPKATTLRPAELIAAVELSFLPKRPTRQLFRKVGTRAAQALSKTVAAGLLWLDGKGRVEELRFALGATCARRRRSSPDSASRRRPSTGQWSFWPRTSPPSTTCAPRPPTASPSRGRCSGASCRTEPALVVPGSQPREGPGA
jgi:CO/xanthine dehydrogenase FAD-binding subunit